MGKRFSQAQRDEILAAIKSGLSVAEAATQFGVSTHSIYAWLKVQVDNTGTSSLELSRLRRENKELKELIGALSLDNARSKKSSPWA